MRCARSARSCGSGWGCRQRGRGLLPEKLIHDDPDWKVIVGDYNRVEANYLLMHENLCDLSHLPYLHAKSFGTGKGYAEVPLTVEKEGTRVTFYRHTENRWDLIKFIYPPSVDFSNLDFEHRSGGTFLSPAMHSGYGKLSPRDGSPQLTHNVNHFLTPEHQDSCHYSGMSLETTRWTTTNPMVASGSSSPPDLRRTKPHLD